MKVQTLPQPFTHEFGFAQSQRDYSLAEFREAANNFKQDYFRMQPHVSIFMKQSFSKLMLSSLVGSSECGRA